MARWIERELLPILNLLVLAAPLVLFALELTYMAAAEITLPDLGASIAELETPPAPRSTAQIGAGDSASKLAPVQLDDAPLPETPRPELGPAFPDPMLGYGP